MAGALALLATAPPAGAVDLKVSGAWTAFRTATSDGTNICGVSSALAEGRIFYVKWYQGDDHLTVQAFKPTWQIPPGVKAKVSLTFAGNTPWTATSASSTKVSNIVEFNFPKPVVKQFVQEFTSSPSGKLEFAGGSEAPWPLDNTGSSVALNVMSQCIDGVAGAGGDNPLAYLRQPAPTFGAPPQGGQPFGTQPPAQGGQPFGAPKPSQPF